MMDRYLLIRTFIVFVANILTILTSENWLKHAKCLATIIDGTLWLFLIPIRNGSVLNHDMAMKVNEENLLRFTKTKT